MKVGWQVCAVKKKISSGPGWQACASTLNEKTWLRARWWVWLVMSAQSSWRKIRLTGYLGKGSRIISTSEHGWNIQSMNHAWKSNGSIEDTKHSPWKMVKRIQYSCRKRGGKESWYHTLLFHVLSLQATNQRVYDYCLNFGLSAKIWNVRYPDLKCWFMKSTWCNFSDVK